mgnify:CR=1 FL=1
MTFFDIISFAKLFSHITSGNMTMSDAEMEAAAKVLKEFGGNAPNWNPMQRELYKAMVDATKDGFRGQQNG